MKQETPFIIGVALLTGEFGYAIYLTFAESHSFALYLAVRYAVAEEWSPIHYLKDKAARICWRHIPKGQCIPKAGV